jgi:hypothetical protein
MVEEEEKSAAMNQRINTQQENYAGEAEQQLQITDQSSHQRGRPIYHTHNCLKIISRRKGKKLVTDHGWWPDTRENWLTDRQL